MIVQTIFWMKGYTLSKKKQFIKLYVCNIIPLDVYNILNTRVCVCINMKKSGRIHTSRFRILDYL